MININVPRLPDNPMPQDLMDVASLRADAHRRALLPGRGAGGDPPTQLAKTGTPARKGGFSSKV